MYRFAFAAALALPTAAFAAGTEDSTPPKPTKTTTDCTEGQVWSEEMGKCVDAEEQSLNDLQRLDAAREFAYAGQYLNTLNVLAAMADQEADMVLTYKGFAHRKMGDVALGNAYYRQAIKANPDNLLARSYMGQGFVESGDLVAAKAQLSEIRARGGRSSWAEVSLRMAIDSGTGYSY